MNVDIHSGTQRFLSRESRWSVVNFLSDQAVQHGIKCGLAAMLAWWVAQTIRLPNPTWALITVFVLALAPYVGSMGEKGLLRIVGTLVGGFLGMLLVGNFANNIFIIVGGMFTILTICTWLFGWNRFPYAFFLCALTTNVVVSSGLSDPDNAWAIALHRFLEVSIGVGSTLLINSLLWPRYARLEFKDKLWASLRDIRTMFADAVGKERASEETVRGIEASLISTLIAIRLLLRYGSAESLPFRQRVPIYMRLTPEFAMLFFSVFALRRNGGSSMMENLDFRAAMHEIESDLLEMLDLLIAGKAAEVTCRTSQFQVKLDHSKQRLEQKLAPHGGGQDAWMPSRELVAASALLVALEDVYYHVAAIAKNIEELEEPSEALIKVDPYAWTPRLRRYWLHSALKGAVATCIALIFCNWFQPPGADLIPLAAWVIVVLSRGYVHGEGDRRCFQYAAWAVLLLIGFCGLLLIGTPLMASYAVTNTFLFLSLFLFGYSVIKIGGITFWLQILLLAGCSAFGLNPQEPVAFQAIVGVFFGMTIGCLIGALVQRLIWPLLPPLELKNTFIEFIGACRDFYGESDSKRLQILRVAMTTAPTEMIGWAKRLDTPDVPPGEQEKWMAFIFALREMSNSLRALVRLFRDPTLIGLLAKIDPAIDKQHHALNEEFNALIAAFENQDTTKFDDDCPRLDLAGFIHALLETRPTANLDPPELLQLLGLSQRWITLENALSECRKKASTLNLSKYFGDYAL